MTLNTRYIYLYWQFSVAKYTSIPTKYFHEYKNENLSHFAFIKKNFYMLCLKYVEYATPILFAYDDV